MFKSFLRANTQSPAQIFDVDYQDDDGPRFSEVKNVNMESYNCDNELRNELN